MTAAPSRPEVMPALHRVRSLDGIRGLAILCVITTHLLMVPERPPGDALNTALSGGWFGVDLFFALSGFLITGILLRARDHAGYFSSFYLRRTLRIFPLYYGFLFLAFVLLPLAGQTKFVSAQEPYYWLYLTNLMPLMHVDGAWQLGHFWSLAIEEQFYLAWPLVIWACPTRVLVWAIPAVTAGIVAARIAWMQAGGAPIVIYTFTLTHLDPILLGSLAAIVIQRGADVARLHAWSGAILAASLVLLGLLAAGNHGSLSWNSMLGITAFIPLFSWIAVSGLLYIVTAAAGHPLRRLAETRTLVFFGTYSYSIYLVHSPLHGFLQLASAPGRPLHALVSTTGHEHLVIAVLTFAASVLVALATWHGYEKWFLRLKPKHTERPVAVAPAAPAAP